MIEKISTFFKSKEGSIIFSVIIGLGLACIFKKSCSGSNCVVIKAPDPNTIKGKVFKHGQKCYSYIPESAKCNVKGNTSPIPS